MSEGNFLSEPVEGGACDGCASGRVTGGKYGEGGKDGVAAGRIK